MAAATDGGTVVDHMPTGDRHGPPMASCAWPPDTMTCPTSMTTTTGPWALPCPSHEGVFEPRRGQQLMAQGGDDDAIRLMQGIIIIHEPLQRHTHIIGTRGMTMAGCRLRMLRCSMG